MTALKNRIPLILGRLALFAGLFTIFSALFHKYQNRAIKLETYLPIFIHSAALATTLFTGLVMILLGRGLKHRKRRAWALSILIYLLNISMEFFRTGIHPLQVTISLTILALLIIFRAEFYAESDPKTKWQPLLSFILTFTVFLSIATLFLLVRHRESFVGNPSFGNILLTVLAGFVGVTGPIEFLNERTSDAVGVVLATLGFFTLLVPLALFFRRVKPIAKLNDEEIHQIRALLKRDQDQDSLGYFATRRDKSVIWSKNGKAGIAYRVQSGVMLASGDPFGEFSLWPEAIDAFLEEARKHAWTPAVMGASDHGGEVWVERANMLAIDIGDEAIIRVKDFTLEGRPMANVRQMVNRIKRKGYSAYTSRWDELPESTKSELRHLAKKWRYGVPERGFSMSMDRFGEDLDNDTYITIAEQDGKIKGLLYFVPWTDENISLDRMQRERETDPGVNELMIVTSAEWAIENNFKNISLNFAAFRSLFERADKISAGPITRGMRNVIRFFSNFFQVESLYRFNAKFNPDWQTRYVLYPKAADLPRVAWAALRAENFIDGFKSRSKK